MLFSRKQIVIAVLLFVSLVLVISAIYYVTDVDRNKFGNEVKIANLSEYTKNHPSNKEKIDHIQYDLLNTINLNLINPVGDRAISDILVRDGSFSYALNEKTTVHSVDFIVDIESIRQSYAISYQWADSDQARVDEWGTAVKCLEEKDVKFKDFKCTDMFKQMSPVEDEKLSKLLPYESSQYKIASYPTDAQVVISIQIMSNRNSERTKKRFTTYQKEATDWLRSKGVKLGDYRIEVRDMSSNLVQTIPRTNYSS